MSSRFEFGSRTYMMGILNLTPDSFSGDGLCGDPWSAVEKAAQMVRDGADIIDVGGESTRPGALPIEPKEEIKRVMPVIEKLARRISVPISIDTRRSEVARRALESGASVINDITGLESDPAMAEVAARYGAKVIIMHMKGEPLGMQANPFYNDLIGEIIEKLSELIRKAEEKGVKKDDIIIDPGMGFGKTFEHNLEILDGLSHFKILGKPILVGPSRKSFIGHILGAEPKDRVFGTAASVAIAIHNGADIIRAHDVKEMKEVAKVADSIVRSKKAVNV